MTIAIIVLWKKLYGKKLRISADHHNFIPSGKSGKKGDGPVVVRVTWPARCRAGGCRGGEEGRCARLWEPRAGVETEVDYLGWLLNLFTLPHPTTRPPRLLYTPHLEIPFHQIRKALLYSVITVQCSARPFVALGGQGRWEGGKDVGRWLPGFAIQ